MQLVTAHNNYTALSHQATPKKKKKKPSQTENLAAVEHTVAPFCTNKAGEVGPKTDLQRLLAASCDCV